MKGHSQFLLDRRTFLSAAAVSGLAGPWAQSALFAQPAENKLAAFILGIDRYQQLRPLERAVADAEAVARKIDSFGYDVELVKNAGSEDFFAGFGRFLERLEPGSAVFLYLAAHGIQASGTNFILPADTRSEGDALLESAIQTGFLFETIAAARPSQAIVILDACRDEPLDVTLDGRGDGFVSTNAPGGFYVTYSAGAGQYAIDHMGDNDTHPNGLFVRHLLGQMAPDVLIDDIIKSTRESVLADAQSIGRNQCPAIYDQAGRDIRLDARKAPPRRSRRSARGTLANSGAIIVGIERYCGYSKLARLMTPHSDARRLAADFEELGAEVTLLLEPSRDELLASCAELAAKPLERRFVYLAGQGGLMDRDAWMFMPQEAQSGMPVCSTQPVLRGIGIGKQQDDPFYGVTLIGVGDIIAAFDFENVHLLCDFCLDDLGLDEAWKPSLGLDDRMTRRGILDELRPYDYGDDLYPQCSVLFAASYYQTALDAAPGQRRSPFAIALTNALGRPGMTVEQFANYVRKEVEALTDRHQSPMLFCENKTQDAIMIGSA
ncbi:MAG: caspase family protein [Pseudomonadota bacterium]